MELVEVVVAPARRNATAPGSMATGGSLQLEHIGAGTATGGPGSTATGGSLQLEGLGVVVVAVVHAV
eukprot:11936552-Alexandrium_andersonii.AAC.1